MRGHWPAGRFRAIEKKVKNELLHSARECHHCSSVHTSVSEIIQCISHWMDVFKLDITDVGQFQFSYSLPVIKLSIYRPKALDGLYTAYPISRFQYFIELDMGSFH